MRLISRSNLNLASSLILILDLNSRSSLRSRSSLSQRSRLSWGIVWVCGWILVWGQSQVIGSCFSSLDVSFVIYLFSLPSLLPLPSLVLDVPPILLLPSYILSIISIWFDCVWYRSSHFIISLLLQNHLGLELSSLFLSVKQLGLCVCQRKCRWG